MKKTVYKKLGISIIASTLLASQLSTVSALSVISSTGEEYEVSETLEKGPESNDSSLSEISPTYGSYYQKQSEVLSLQEVAEEVKTSGGSTTSIAELLEQFLFPRSTHGTLIEKLSGGEKKRLYLLKLLLEKPNVLLLDEPTNDLDIATLTVLENFLQGFAGPVLTVSHDRYFLDKVATKILAFEDGKIRPFFGHYTDYLDEKAFETDMANQVQKAEKEKVVKVREDKKRMTYQEKQEWASIEGDIETLEKRIAAIEEEMQANGSDFGKLATLQKELDEKNEALLEKYERYEYLSEFDS
ncbi:ATPase component of ABC transporter with duplicated ATPase domains [Streptococcus pneumoniae]|nr:ATPase component of ABC transporter with duplicated ATPase domains [Streptococcus pneumoniae]